MSNVKDLLQAFEDLKFSKTDVPHWTGIAPEAAHFVILPTDMAIHKDTKERTGYLGQFNIYEVDKLEDVVLQDGDYLVQEGNLVVFASTVPPKRVFKIENGVITVNGQDFQFWQWSTIPDLTNDEIKAIAKFGKESKRFDYTIRQADRLFASWDPSTPWVQIFNLIFDLDTLVWRCTETDRTYTLKDLSSVGDTQNVTRNLSTTTITLIERLIEIKTTSDEQPKPVLAEEQTSAMEEVHD